jgi:hypothetical protein
MSLLAVVYDEELEKDGRSAVFFNVRTPNEHFKHYAQPQSSRGGQAATVRGLLAKVRQDYPQARQEEVDRTTWIVRE